MRSLGRFFWKTIETESATFAVAVGTAYRTTAFTHRLTSAIQNGDRKGRDFSRITSVVQFLPGEHVLEGDWYELAVENVSNLTL